LEVLDDAGDDSKDSEVHKETAMLHAKKPLKWEKPAALRVDEKLKPYKDLNPMVA
jgi:hypothetical protein